MKVCLTQVKRLFDFNMEMLCFEQTQTIRVNILNKNDNEPRLKSLSGDELTLNTRQLMRAMTLFKFRIDDDDADLNEFKYRTFNDSFDIFQMNDHYGVKLSDLGYSYLVNLIETNSLIDQMSKTYSCNVLNHSESYKNKILYLTI